jgi:hypothetical protein
MSAIKKLRELIAFLARRSSIAASGDVLIAMRAITVIESSRHGRNAPPRWNEAGGTKKYRSGRASCGRMEHQAQRGVSWASNQ